MIESQFHRAAERLIAAFDAGELSYEEFDEAYERLLDELDEDNT